MCDTSSHAGDHLYQIWKESIKNCRWYRADTACGTDGRTDRRTDGQTDGRTDGRSETSIPPPNKYGKNPSRTVDATERTRFSRSRPNDLEDIGQGQRSLYATHPLMLVIICAKYGKNPLRILDFFFQGQGQKVLKICQNFKFPDSEKNVTRDTPSNDSYHLCQI